MINHNKIEDISKVLNKKGNTEVRLKVKENEHNLIFQLKKLLWHLLLSLQMM